MNKKSRKLFDLLVVSGIVLSAIPVSFFLGAKFIVSTVFFFVLPSVYLLYRFRGPWKRLITAASLFGVVYGFILDYLAEMGGAWSWSGTDQIFFSRLILGVVNIDIMVWFFFWVFFIIIFYEHFLEHDRSDKISPNIKYALFPGVAVLALIIILNFINPAVLKWNYAYFWLGLFTLPPFVFVVYRNPRLIYKFFKSALFFVPLYFVYEITALGLGQWHFPGQYVGMVNVGQVVFPLEELVIWILLSSSIVLSYYELYVDDLK